MDCNLESSYYVWFNSMACTKQSLNKLLLNEQMHEWINDSEQMNEKEKKKSLIYQLELLGCKHQKLTPTEVSEKRIY